MTNILPLNDMAREKSGPVLTSAGFVSLNSHMYVLKGRGKIKEVRQGEIFPAGTKTRVLLAPEGTVHDVVKTNINRAENTSYAVYELVPPGNQAVHKAYARSRVLKFGTALMSMTVIIGLSMHFMGHNALRMGMSGDAEVIGPKSYDAIIEILKDDSFLVQRKNWGDDPHTKEFIERIRAFHSTANKKKEGAK